MLELKEEAECLGTEMNSGMTGSHRGTAQLTSATDGNSSLFLTRQLCRLGAGFRDHNLSGAF